MKTWRRIHRWLAIVLVIPLIVWSITGLLFHLKPGWGRAYDMLDAERPGAKLQLAQLQALERGDVEISHVDMFDTALGPLVRVATTKGTALYDAATGKRRSPLSEADARALAADAISRSPHHADYGEPARVTTSDDAVKIEMSGGATVEVGRTNAQLSQRGGDTDRIDWLYRIHYLQWTGLRTLDRVLAVVGLALIWLVLVPGVVLFVCALPRRARLTASGTADR